MNRTRHEVIVLDGIVRLRSQISSPVRVHLDDEATILNEESAVPPDLAGYLFQLINLHEEKLINTIGTLWMGRKS